MESEKFRVIVLTVFIIGIFIISIWGLSNYFKYAEELRSEPLTYGAKKYNLDYCNCFGEAYSQFTFDREKVIYTSQMDNSFENIERREK